MQDMQESSGGTSAIARPSNPMHKELNLVCTLDHCPMCISSRLLQRAECATITTKATAVELHSVESLPHEALK